jgi:trimethylamine:corrinoid methyltransferase-like protein
MNPFTTNNARLLGDEQMVKTHEASLEILQEVGMEVYSDTDWEERGGHDAWDKSLLVAKETIGRQGLSDFSAEADVEIRSQFENMVPGEVLIPEGW